MAYFPMYVNIEDQSCLVVGGGKIALQKVNVLTDFGAKVEVVAEDICDMLSELGRCGKIIISKRSFDVQDVEGKVLVVAATDDRRLNHEISVKCKEKNIPVNAVDQKEDCTFIFPTYVKEKDLVASFSSSGKSPLIIQELKQREKEILTPMLGELNEQLGNARIYAAEKIKDVEVRKQVYRKIFEEFERTESLVSDERIWEIIDSYEV